MDEHSVVEERDAVASSSPVLEALRAVPGLSERLARGIHVADVACGWRDSTITMAAAFPRSRFLAVEPDASLVERARRVTTTRGLRNVYWLAAAPHELAPLPTHDLISAFDGIHDMRDPCAALRAIRAALADDGLYLWSALSEDQADVWQLGVAAGFSRVEALSVPAASSEFFALRK